MTSTVPTCPSLAPCSPPSRPLRAASGGGLRPVLTAAARGATLSAGRDEETAPSVEPRNCTRYHTILQNFPHTTRRGQHYAPATAPALATRCPRSGPSVLSSFVSRVLRRHRNVHGIAASDARHLRGLGAKGCLELAVAPLRPAARDLRHGDGGDPNRDRIRLLRSGDQKVIKGAGQRAAAAAV